MIQRGYFFRAFSIPLQIDKTKICVHSTIVNKLSNFSDFLNYIEWDVALACNFFSSVCIRFLWAHACAPKKEKKRNLHVPASHLC